MDCLEECPNSIKEIAGACGCDVHDIDSDGDGLPDCLDECPLSSFKVVAGVCGCGMPDDDIDKDGILDCLAPCTNSDKDKAGVCGCGIVYTDSDNDTMPDCLDKCPYDAKKIEVGVCGCGVQDSTSNLADNDNDGIPACNDLCPNSTNTNSVTSLSTTSAWTITGESTSQKLGNAVAIAGDINGDGYDDILVGDPKNKQVSVFYGSAAGLANNANFHLTSDKTSFGSVVAGAGDINGDGYDDVLVSAPEYDSKKGIVYLYLGSNRGLSDAAQASFTATVINGFFGSVLSKVGDVNAVGFDDFVIASPKCNNNRGRYSLYLGRSSGTISASHTEIDSVNDSLGSAITPLGDFDKDGYADFAVAANNVVYVHYGNALGKNLSKYTYRGTSGEAFGTAVAGVGDISGSGYPSLIVTSPVDKKSGSKVTYSHISFIDGGDVQKVVPSSEYWLYAKKANVQFGKAISAAGDVDGTGTPKYIVSIPKEGNGYIVLNPTLKSNGEFDSEWTLTASKAGEFTGAVLVGDCNINGDGYSDVVIGTPNYDDGKGRVQLFIGGAKHSTTCLDNSSHEISGYTPINDEFQSINNASQEEQSSIIQNTCYDSDNGKNITNYGRVSFKGKVFKDTCSRKVLTEYFCNQNIPVLKLFSCAKGCKKGVCLSKKTKRLTAKQKTRQKKLKKRLNTQLNKLEFS